MVWFMNRDILGVGSFGTPLSPKFEIARQYARARAKGNFQRRGCEKG